MDGAQASHLSTTVAMVPKCSRLLMISDTTEFRHQHPTQPFITAEDWVLHGIQHLTAVLQGISTSHFERNILTLHSLQDVINSWCGVQAPAHTAHWPKDDHAQPAPTYPASNLLSPASNRNTWMERLLSRHPVPRVPANAAQPTRPAPTAQSTPSSHPVASWTRSKMTQPTQQPLSL